MKEWDEEGIEAYGEFHTLERRTYLKGYLFHGLLQFLEVIDQPGKIE